MFFCSNQDFHTKQETNKSWKSQKKETLRENMIQMQKNSLPKNVEKPNKKSQKMHTE